MKKKKNKEFEKTIYCKNEFRKTENIFILSSCNVEYFVHS